MASAITTAAAYRKMLELLADRTSLSKVALTAANLAHDLLGGDGASVTQVDGHAATYLAAVGTLREMKDRRLPLADSFTGAVVQEGRPLIFDPRAAPGGSTTRAREDEIRSGIVCPIILDGHVVGTIGVYAHAQGLYDAADMERLAGFASFIALGLERNRTNSRLERTYHFYKMGKFASFLAQEIDAPLASLLSSLRDIREVVVAAPEALRSPVECSTMEAFQEVEKVTRLVGDLRALATDDADRAPVDLDPHETITRVASYLRDRIEKHAQFEVMLSPEPARVRAVPGRLWQVAYAALINAVEAIEHTPRGMNSVELTTRNTGTHLEVSVRDTGCGIRPEHMPFVFEPFFSTKSRERRAGLGLTLVWRYVNAIGGSVDIDSRPNEGTTLTITLPTISS